MRLGGEAWSKVSRSVADPGRLIFRVSAKIRLVEPKLQRRRPNSEVARLRAKLADGAIDAFSVRVSTLWRMFRDRAEF